MNRAPVIARRELSSYFYSPIAYVALTLFLGVSGFLFYRDFQPGQPAGMRNIFYYMIWVLVFVIPVLSMGLLAQEWATGTIETLMTAPLGETDIVIGKFLGAFSFFGVLLLPTLLYVALLKIFGHVDIWPIASGYLGILLVGSLFISVGLFCSGPYPQPGGCGRVGGGNPVSDHRRALARRVPERFNPGTMALPDRSGRPQPLHRLCQRHDRYRPPRFFLALTAVFLFITVKVLESRRWK